MVSNWVEDIKESLGIIFDGLTVRDIYRLKVPDAYIRMGLFPVGRSSEQFTDVSAVRGMHIIPKLWKDMMVNCATSYYLNLWMCYDLQSKNNIHDYANQIYDQRCGGSQCKDEDCADSERLELIRKFHLNKSKYVDVIDAMKLKEKIDGFPYYDFIYSLKKENGELKECPIDEQESPRLYRRSWLSPVVLQLIKWMVDGDFLFVNQLFYRKSFLMWHNTKHFNRSIRETYAAYFKLIANLKRLDDPKEYVLSALAIQQFEPIFEHMSAACLAASKENYPHYVSMETLRQNTVAWWYCEVVRTQCEDRSIKSNKIYLKNIGDYLSQMNAAMWGVNPTVKDPNVRHILKKMMLDDMLNTYFNCLIGKTLNWIGNVTDYPIGVYNPLNSLTEAREEHFKRIHRKWTDEDYAAAMEFFKKDYPIIENHISFQLGNPMDWSDSMVESIRDYYNPLFEGNFGFVRCEIKSPIRSEVDAAKEKNEKVNVCPKCGKKEFVKAGFSAAGTQRYWCKECEKYFSQNPKKPRYSLNTRCRALEMLDGNTERKKGMSVRTIAKKLGCSKSSVSYWKKGHSKKK